MLMWGLWIYFFMPIISFILWLIGVRHFYVELIEKGGYLEFLDLIHRLGWTIIVVFAILRLWGYYNYIKFGGLNRRKFPQPTRTGQLSDHYKVSDDLINEMQGIDEILWDTELNIPKAISKKQD